MSENNSTLDNAFDQQRKAFSNQPNSGLSNVPYYAQDIKRSIDLVNYKLNIIMSKLDLAIGENANED